MFVFSEADSKYIGLNPSCIFKYITDYCIVLVMLVITTPLEKKENRWHHLVKIRTAVMHIIIPK